MKKFAFLIILSTISVLGFSQKQGQKDVGIKAGVNIADLSGENAKNVESRTAMNAGILMRYFLMSNMAFQAELFYGGHGGKENVNNVLRSYRFSSLFLPLLMNFYLNSAYITVGPQ